MKYEMKDYIPMVSSLARQYTSKESSSISEEKAKQFMEAVLFTMELAQKEQGKSEEKDELSQQNLTAKETYLLGGKILVQRFQVLQKKYDLCMKHFDSYGVLCLEEVMKKGFPAFFQYYDLTYEPQNELLTLDYPVLYDVHKKHGICAIEEYLDAIQIEQKFLQLFDRQQMITILEQIDASYEELFINITEHIYDFFLEYRLHTLLEDEKGKVLSQTQFFHIMDQAKREFHASLKSKLKQNEQDFNAKYSNRTIQSVNQQEQMPEKQIQEQINEIAGYLDRCYQDICIRKYYKYKAAVSRE